MTENNLQKSELVISKILDRVIDFGLQEGTELSFQDFHLQEDYKHIYNGCCDWLIAEGIVRCADGSRPFVGNMCMFSPTITSRGFERLNQPFTLGEEVVQDKMSVGQAVREVAQGQKSYAGFGDFVGGVLGGFTKSMAG